jgi:hypothetical protein
MEIFFLFLYIQQHFFQFSLNATDFDLINSQDLWEFVEKEISKEDGCEEFSFLIIFLLTYTLFSHSLYISLPSLLSCVSQGRKLNKNST